MEKFYEWDYIKGKYIESVENFEEWCREWKERRPKELESSEYDNEYAELMRKWASDAAPDEDGRKIFVFDGIINPEEWKKQQVKILFVLKEAYDKSAHNDAGLYAWDESEWVLKQNGRIGKSKTWRRVYQWTKAILEQKSYSEIDDPRWDDGTLDKIAAINIKKTNGKLRSVGEELREHAKRHSKELLAQIKMINPDVIVCGYTCWLLDSALETVSEEPVRTIKNDRWKYKTKSLSKNNEKEVTVIDFWHPACMGEDKEIYEKLIESYNAIISNEPESMDGENDVK